MANHCEPRRHLCNMRKRQIAEVVAEPAVNNVVSMLAVTRSDLFMVRAAKSLREGATFGQPEWHLVSDLDGRGWRPSSSAAG